MTTNGVNKKKYPYCYSGHQYALDVVSLKEIANVYIIGACKRYLNDFKKSELFYFDWDAAEHYLRLVQKFHHVKGNWKTPNIVYAPWQNFVFMNIMGWISKTTGERRYRTAYLEIARGNGKSVLASQAALYFCSLIPNRQGNEIACVATKKDQARLVLDAARNMAKKNLSFRKATNTKVLAHKIVQDSTNSVVQALSSDQNTNDGRGDILAIIDELHAIKRTTYEVVDSGMTKRNDSLLLCITTAGYDVDGVGHSQSEYAKKVASGEMQDDSFFSFVCTIDKDDDPWDPNAWKKANPNIGISVDPVNFKAKANKAKANPSDANNFKIKHLNLWISEANAFFNMNDWRKCADRSLDINEFIGEKCYVGIDLASKVDLTSIVYLFYKNGKYYLFDKSYLPEKTIEKVKNPIYDKAIAENHLIKTKGSAIHYPTIREDIVRDSRKFKFIELFYDPWNATEFSQQLKESRLEMVEFRMNTSNFSEPTKALGALISENKIVHNGSKLLEWCFSNVVCKEDAAGNVFPRKSHDKLKIDPAISSIMALAGWTNRETTESVYESRGIRTI